MTTTTQSPSRIDSLEAQVPVFFLASSAFLVALILSQPSAAKQGLLIVVLLWLSVCLQEEEQQQQQQGLLSIYKHGLFLLSVLSLALSFSKNEPVSSYRRPRCIRCSTGVHSLSKSCLIGMWAALCWETFFMQHRQYTSFWAVFASLGHATYAWKERRRQRQAALRQGVEGLPHNFEMSDNTNLQQQLFENHGVGDSNGKRQEWYRWNASNSLQWAVKTCPQHEETLIRLLGPEELTLRQIFGMQAAELKQMTQLPSGVVLELLERVYQLQENYPCPHDEWPKHISISRNWTNNANQNVDSTVRNHNSESWLERYDVEYSNRNLSSAETRRTNQTGREVSTEEIVPDAEVRTILKERFGVELTELPKYPIKDTSKDVESNGNSSAMHFSGDNGSAIQASISSSASLEHVLPPDFVANMPPHIAAIARSKPDLVRKILQSQQTSRTTDQTAPVSTPLASLHEEVEEGVIVVGDEFLEEDDDDDAISGEDGERTELLRQRRKKPPSQLYQSTWRS